MKKIQVVFIAIFAFSIAFVQAQTKQINLEQTKGAFTTENLTLAAGDYQFNISNNGVDHELGFVLVPKGMYDAKSHIKEAYVKAPVANGKSSMTNTVHLEAGEYEYFCPMNPTPKYNLTVVDEVETIKLGQVKGDFDQHGLTIEKGSYQFEIANLNVDHEVGFVLVPKGMYDAKHHIQTAYVKAPVAEGTSSMTGIVELEAGEYEYFCPLNPTPKYNLTVVNK